MSRPVKKRSIEFPPIMQGFTPYGIPLCETENIKLSYEEFESFRLIGYHGLSQEECAAKMNVSRPTASRIYGRAIKKIAQAFVEGKSIAIGGGTFTFNDDWHKCMRCNKLIQNLESHTKCVDCTTFSSSELIKISSIK